MRLFLTSSPCSPYPQADGRILYGYTRENGFLERLREGWEPGCSCVMISSDPADFAGNDRMRGEFQGFFEISGIPVKRLVMCDERNETDLARLLGESRIVILAGGHVPTQNAFFRRIGLKELIGTYEGTVMGISAGTMNCAGIVYAQPELAGESTDPAYRRFLAYDSAPLPECEGFRAGWKVADGGYHLSGQYGTGVLRSAGRQLCAH